MSDTAIVMSGSSALMPAMDMGQAQLAYQAMVEFVRGIMKENVDFGVIPGTPKPTLYKPGAEKLSRFFGLAARFEVTKEVEQWGSEDPLFYYRYKCTLYRMADGQLVSEGEGSCNSHEKKYRYRNADRVCPSCGKAAIIKGKKEYGGGWLCFAKKGGCGAKFPDDHFSGEVEQVLNPDVCDLVNTLQKMAQKRAFIAATLIACNASEYFTQDVEDLDYGVQVVTVVPEATREPAPEPTPTVTVAAQVSSEQYVCNLDGKEIHDLRESLLAKLQAVDPKFHEKHMENRWCKRWDVKSIKGIQETVSEFERIMLLSNEQWEAEIGAGPETVDEQQTILDEAFPRDEHGNPIEDVA